MLLVPLRVESVGAWTNWLPLPLSPLLPVLACSRLDLDCLALFLLFAFRLSVASEVWFVLARASAIGTLLLPALVGGSGLGYALGPG